MSKWNRDLELLRMRCSTTLTVVKIPQVISEKTRLCTILKRSPILSSNRLSSKCLVQLAPVAHHSYYPSLVPRPSHAFQHMKRSKTWEGLGTRLLLSHLDITTFSVNFWTSSIAFLSFTRWGSHTWHAYSMWDLTKYQIDIVVSKNFMRLAHRASYRGGQVHGMPWCICYQHEKTKTDHLWGTLPSICSSQLTAGCRTILVVGVKAKPCHWRQDFWSLACSFWNSPGICSHFTPISHLR